MWTPKTSNKSNSNRVDVNGRTHMTPYSTPSVPSSAISNESGGNNQGLHNNIHGSFTPYFPGSYASRSSTNIVGLPSGIQQTQGGSSSMRNTSHVLNNEPSQSFLGSSHGYSGITKTGGPTFIPNKPHLIPNKGHTGRIVNSMGGFVSEDGSGSSSTVLANVSSPVSGLKLSGLKRTKNFSFFQHNQYFGIPNEDFPPWSPFEGGLDIGVLVDYRATQRQKENLVQPPQQYTTMGRSPGFMFGAINASHYPPQQDHDSSRNETGFSFPMPGNQDLHFHGSEQYQHFLQSQSQSQSQPQPRFYNPLRGKEVAQGSLLGPEDYGLLGLLKTIKGANPEKSSLAMGVDLQSLGLDLNSLEPLHKKFASPWSDQPVKEGPNYYIPDCYKSKQPPPLKRSHFKKFHLAMLFYIFYSMPQDQAQLFAANELHDRGWYFHRELHMWFSRDKNSVPTVKNAAYEVGCYICFDPSTWQTIRQENVVLYYRMIEQRPTIPP